MTQESSTADTTPEATGTFDTSMERLESCVQRLETGQLSLEEALAVFEQGISASRACASLLDQSRKRVQVLVEKAGGDFQLEFLEPMGDDEVPPEAEQGDASP